MIRYIISLFLGVGLVACQSPVLPPLSPERPLGEHNVVDFRQVQALVNSRCIACHSCMESPCQLNMQTWEGLKRGAFHLNVYDGTRTKAVAPTRMFSDAMTEKQWRGMGFADVMLGDDDSILVKTLRLSHIRTSSSDVTVRESKICPMESEQIKTKREQVEQLAMPYGLPALSQGEQELLADWVAAGAPGTSNLPLTTATLPAPIKAQVLDWEHYLNAQDTKSRVVSRYLYEHLYLAHLYFKEAPRDFLDLVRSASPCEQGVHVLSTRRPNDDPGVLKWYYCFYRDPAAVVYKNHLPYELGPKKLAWLKNNFATPAWEPTRYPSFAPEVAANPLVAFDDIPVIARYRFLLSNAQYEVMTFIKGPVCNGSFAVNSIQEQFYVFFGDPKTDLMVIDPAYAEKVAKELILPGEYGTDPDLSKIVTGYHEILKARSVARQELANHLVSNFPKGLSLKQIWDGDGYNDNAVLTVFRNDDNAKVVKGARGDLSKSVFVLDYSTFERLVYNLVINFDVYDNVSHQTLTRLYMDVLRMDAEDNFLQFLPIGERGKIKDQWYQGLLTSWKVDLLDEKKFAPIPTAIPFIDGEDSKIQMVRKILFERLASPARGADDTINWKRLKVVENQDPLESELRRIASVPVRTKPFARFFPEMSVLVVRDKASPGHALPIYSILHNREHQNVSWILNESDRLSPTEDTLTILPGVLGGYPNQFFVVDRSELAMMMERTLAIHDDASYHEFLKQYGVARLDSRLWSLYDDVNASLSQREPVEAGVLDLSRYAK